MRGGHQQRAEGVQRQAGRPGRLHLRQPRRVLEPPAGAHQPACHSGLACICCTGTHVRQLQPQPLAPAGAQKPAGHPLSWFKSLSLLRLQQTPPSGSGIASFTRLRDLTSLHATRFHDQLLLPLHRPSPAASQRAGPLRLVCRALQANAEAWMQVSGRPNKQTGKRTGRFGCSRRARAGAQLCGLDRAASLRPRCPRPAVPPCAWASLAHVAKIIIQRSFRTPRLMIRCTSSLSSKVE